MSTKAERASRARYRILPIKFPVRQRDGSYIVQICDARVGVPKRAGRGTQRAAAIRFESTEIS